MFDIKYRLCTKTTAFSFLGERGKSVANKALVFLCRNKNISWHVKVPHFTIDQKICTYSLHPHLQCPCHISDLSVSWELCRHTGGHAGTPLLLQLSSTYFCLFYLGSLFVGCPKYFWHQLLCLEGTSFWDSCRLFWFNYYVSPHPTITLSSQHSHQR